MGWKPIETAPKDRTVYVRAPNRDAVSAIWYFGAWGTVEPILGDRLLFEPTEWMDLNLVEALQFYADETNWDDDGGPYDDYSSVAKRDYGDLARAVLKHHSDSQLEKKDD